MATSKTNRASAPRPERMIWLIIGIPLVSVVMGALMLFLALGENDALMQVDERPLSKTSWKEAAGK